MINALLFGWDLLELGLGAKTAESITGDHADSPLTGRWELIFGSRGFESSLYLLRRCFFHHSRGAEGPCEAAMCYRKVAALAVASSQSDQYFHRQLSKKFYEGTCLHWLWSYKLRGEVGRREAMTSLHWKQEIFRTENEYASSITTTVLVTCLKPQRDRMGRPSNWSSCRAITFEASSRVAKKRCSIIVTWVRGLARVRNHKSVPWS